MSTVKLLPMRSAFVRSGSTTAAFRPLTDWDSCVGLAHIQAVAQIQAEVGNLSIQVGYLLAKVRTDQPRSAAQAIGSALTTNNTYAFRELNSFAAGGVSDPGENFFVRFGLLYSSSDGNEASGTIRLQVCVQRKGVVAGRVEGRQLSTLGASTALQYLPITRFVPTVGVSKVRAGAIWSGVDSNDLSYQFYYRTAAAEPTVADAWQAIGSSQSVSGQDAEYLLSDTALTLSGKAFVQIGLGYQPTATAPTHGTLSAIAGLVQ